MKQLTGLLFILIFTRSQLIHSNRENELNFAAFQFDHWIESHPDPGQHPNATDDEGEWKTVKRKHWVSGFFSGCLWYLYEWTDNKIWKDRAETWTADLKSLKNYAGDHDMGFRMFCSYGNGYRMTGRDDYRAILITSAQTLAERFDPEIGMIKSWDDTDWAYPVIIDNMMNLELLFWAAKNGGDPSLYDLAVMHADNTIKHLIREDGSTFHVVDFDEKGNVTWKGTRQGYSDTSTWTRGQAWSIYGFTVTCRETNQERYLKTAIDLADYFIEHLPEDRVPYSDFQAPNIPECEKDPSAAAIAASALLELNRYVPSKAYDMVAERILTSLSGAHYSAKNTDYESVPRRASSWYSGREKGLIFVDYYYIEALLRLIT